MCSILLVHMEDLVREPEATVRAVLRFVGADPGRFRFQALEARMAGEYKGARVHPSVRALLGRRVFGASNRGVAAMCGGRALGWAGCEAVDVEAPGEEERPHAA